MIGWLVMALCAANMLRSVVFASPAVQPWDFICFWTAGHAWSLGVSPYDMTAPVNAVPTGFTQWPFVYPPAARVLFEPFGWLPMAASWQLYKLAQVLCWAAAAWLIGGRMPLRWPRPARAACVMAFLGAVSYPAMASTGAGQVVAFLVLAVSAVLALPPGRGAPLIVGVVLFVLSLKPQLGLPLALVICARWADWRGIGVAVLLVAAATVWGSAGRPDIALAEWSANLAIYGEQGPNTVGRMSGLPLIAGVLSLPPLGGAAYAVISLAPAAALCVLRVPRQAALFAACVALLLIQPNHEYGYLLIVPFAPLILAMPARLRAAILAACLLSAQSVPLALAGRTVTVGDYFVGAIIDTVAISAVAACALAWLMPPVRSSPSALPA